MFIYLKVNPPSAFIYFPWSWSFPYFCGVCLGLENLVSCSSLPHFDCLDPSLFDDPMTWYIIMSMFFFHSVYQRTVVSGSLPTICLVYKLCFMVNKRVH